MCILRQPPDPGIDVIDTAIKRLQPGRQILFRQPEPLGPVRERLFAAGIAWLASGADETSALARPRL